MVQKKRIGVEPVPAWTILSPIKVELVQPKEVRRGKKVQKESSLRRVDISPDFSRLVWNPRSRHPPPTASSPPPPLPEPPCVDTEAVLREVLSDEEASPSLRSRIGFERDRVTTKTVHPDYTSLTEVCLRGHDRSASPRQLHPNSTSATRDRLVHLFDQLLADIYSRQEFSSPVSRRRSDTLIAGQMKRGQTLNRHHSHCGILRDLIEVTPPFSISETQLQNQSVEEVRTLLVRLKDCISETGDDLVGCLQERDRLIIEHQGLCDLLTASLQAISAKRSLREVSISGEDTEVRFSVSPCSSDSGFAEWTKAMKMVARLPDGVPAHFRKNLWLNLAEKHISSRNICWSQIERSIFSDRLNPDDQELSVQIVKDLHRTGCSLFCGASGQHNQAVLKRVLLAYARWNKNVGYCQGLNMLAALILQVMQGCQGATVKVMVYLIEGVLPESYFADNLRGLSVDMAVFRDLLSIKLPDLSRHLDQLQQDAKESGTSYEPPLMDVFTMQWFLTIFCNCLPQQTVLRLWDLLFLEGDTVLIKAALVIWQSLAERMMSVRSADEFYSIMAVLTREMMEFGLMDATNLVKAMDTLPVPELSELRDRYVYNISPWPLAAKKGLRIFYPHEPSGPTSDDLREPRMTPISNHPDREKIALDITALKKQYWKLRERQRQAHIILSAACRSENYNASSSPALNHLLLGKSALRSVKARRIQGETLHWRDAKKNRDAVESKPSSASVSPDSPEGGEVEEAAGRPPSSSSSSSSSTELCDSSESEPEAGSTVAVQVLKSPTIAASSPPTLKSPMKTVAAASTGQSLKSPAASPTTPAADLAETKKKEDLLRILKENSEILGRIRRSKEEPEDIREIRRRYAPDPFPGRNSSKPREVGVKLGLYTQPTS